MINFFRKNRKQLADENKFFKYARYAIGEIILVVIGILIALQINTWDEERQTDKKIISLFKEIQTDLLKDILNVEVLIADYKMKDSLIYLVLNDKISREDYKSEPENLFSLIADFRPLNFNTNGYDILKLNADDIPLTYKPEYDTLTKLYEESRISLENQNRRIGNAVYENIEYLSDNKEWFSSTSWPSNDTIIDYFLHDPFYKNRVKEFRILIDDYYQIYKIDAIKAYEQLSVITKTDNPLPEHLQTYIVDPEILSPYLGVYIHGDTTREVTIKVTEKGFFYEDYELDLTHVGGDTFSFPVTYNRGVTFQKNDNGEFVGLIITYYDNTTKYLKKD